MIVLDEARSCRYALEAVLQKWVGNRPDSSPDGHELRDAKGPPRTWRQREHHGKSLCL